MKKIRLGTLILVCGIVFSLLFTGSVSAMPQFVRVLVSYPGDINKLLTRSEITHKYKIVNAVAAELSQGRINQLKNNPKIKIEPNSRVKIADTELDNSWGVQQIGAGIVQVSGVTGAGVKVGILDTGIDYTHPELASVYKGGYDFINNDSDPMDDNGHGTHVAGIIAAADDGAGVVGVAPEVQLYSIKVLDASGVGSWSQIIAGLDWAMANGIQITNNSYGAAEYSSIVETAFQNAWKAGIISIAAAGNTGGNSTVDTTCYPARFNSVISVAATGMNNQRASFSSTGLATEVSAPGLNVTSTWSGGGYRVLSGTSIASPHAAGTAALVKSAHPDWDNLAVRGQLRSSAYDLGATGWDSLYGFGLVDAPKAVGSLISDPPQMPPLLPRVMQTVVTLDPADLSDSAVTLKGELTSLGSYSNVKVWFAIGKVGETVSNDTPMQQMTSPGLFSFNKTGLLPQTQYWFFAIAYNGTQCVTGNQLVFTTLATPSGSPTPEPTPSPNPQPNPLPGQNLTTLNTNLTLVKNRIVFGTQTTLNDAGAPNVAVYVNVIDPSGKSYNFVRTSDSSGNVNITVKGNPKQGLWQATITDIAAPYYWDKDDSTISADLTVPGRK